MHVRKLTTLPMLSLRSHVIGMASVVLQVLPAVLLTAPSSHATPCVQDDDPCFLVSLPPDGPAILGLNQLDLTVSAPGFDPLHFTVSTSQMVGNPDWLEVPSSDLGALLFVPVGPQVGDYLLGFLDLGVTVPLSWNGNFNTFDGTDGAVVVSVVATPVFDSRSTDTIQGPGGGGPPINIFVTEVARPNGEIGVRIEGTCSSECTLSFQQFVSTKVTWTATDGTSGVCPMPIKGSGNDEHKQLADGGHVYVDCDDGSGNYPAKPQQANPDQPGTSNRAMEDGPKLKPENVSLLEALLEAKLGKDVSSIKAEFHYTTYVFVTCPPAAPQLKARIEWWYTRTYNCPPMNGPDAPGCPGGPNPPSPFGGFAGGAPTVNMSGGLTMSPDHAAAMTDYLNHTYQGSQTPSW